MCARPRLQTSLGPRAELSPKTQAHIDASVTALIQSCPASRLEYELELRLDDPPPSESDSQESEDEPDWEDWHEDPDGDASQSEDDSPSPWEAIESTLQDLRQRVDIIIEEGPQQEPLLISGLSPLLLRLAPRGGLTRQLHNGLLRRIQDSLQIAQAVVDAHPDFFLRAGLPLVKVPVDQIPLKKERRSNLLKNLSLRTAWGQVYLLREFVTRQSSDGGLDLKLLRWLLEHLEQERAQGPVSEADLAKKWRITPQALGQRRKVLGIPSPRERKASYLKHSDDGHLLRSWVAQPQHQLLRSRLAQLVMQLDNEHDRQLAQLWKDEADRLD